jgi:hypothetical protein
MEIFVLLMLIAFGILVANSRDQRQRIALLSSYLGKYQIEKLMESLTEGYLRALSESDPTRRAQIWNLLNSAELDLSAQFERFVTEFSRVDAQLARVSRFPVAFFPATRLFPGASFDMREALAIHARGIAQAVNQSRDSPGRDSAYTLSAEIFLMQHTCHWFCRSKALASARMMARHKTTYPQLVAAVAANTRHAYLALVNAQAR